MKLKDILLMIIVSLIILVPSKVFSVSAPVWAGDEFLDGDKRQNDAGTIIYDPDDVTLTLNGYDGGPIYYEEGEDLTVILIGKNKITSDGGENGFTATSASIEITGTGSLLIKDAYEGIAIENGDLIINNTTINLENVGSNGISLYDGSFLLNKGSLTITNIFQNGIITFDGGVNIKGTLKMDDDLEAKEELYGFAPKYQAINAMGGKVIVSSDVTINNAGKGFLSDKDIELNLGKIIINAYDKGIHTSSDFIMDGANLLITILEDDNPFLKYGVLSEKNINLSSGKLNILVPENNLPIAAIDYSENGINFTISKDMNFPIEGNTIQDAMLDDAYPIKTIGKEGLTIQFDEDKGGYIITNSINKIGNFEEEINPETSDKINGYLLVGIMSTVGLLLSSLYLQKKAKN